MTLRLPWDDSPESRALADRAFAAFPRLDTPRLALRRLERADAPAFLAVRGDPEVARHFGGVPIRSVEDAAAMIEGYHARFDARQGIRWGIEERDGPGLVGTCGFVTWTRPRALATIGYDLARARWGRGLGTEAVAAMLRFGFDAMRLNRVEAEVMLANEASAKLLLKLGFVEEGVLRERGHWSSAFHDLRLFGLVRRDWERVPQSRAPP